jgi:hypothetical protein
MKVSFDFDATLDKKSVQQFAKRVIKLGIDPYIITNRYSDSMLEYKKSTQSPSTSEYDKVDPEDTNDDLYKVAKEVGIPNNHIHFCNKEGKDEYLKGKNFALHLDDDEEEISNIRKYTDIKVIDVTNPKWNSHARKILKLEPQYAAN